MDRFSSPSAYRRGQVGRGGKVGIITAVIIVIILAVIIGGCQGVKSVGTDHVTFRVTKTLVKGNGDDQKYLIYTTDVNGHEGKIEVFQNTDNIFFGKTDSSDLQAKIEAGISEGHDQFRCKVFGWRIGITSSYRNLINCDQD